jgi:putative CocE/NonD family hydrolase
MCNATEQRECREYGYLSMKDGTRLAYVVWRPSRDGRYAAVLNYSAYEQSGAPFDRVKRFLDAGYAYVGANVRGTGSSEGSFSYFQPVEAEDGAAIVEWIGTQSWCTGDVGMVGSSYGAHTQIAVAARRPRHLKAIIPISSDGCEYRDEAMPGGLFNAGMLASWTFEIHPQMVHEGVQARIAGGDAEAAAIYEKQRSNETYQEVREHPLYDGWWRARSLLEDIGQVNVPILFIQAWQDEWIRPNGALKLFSSIQHTPKKIVLQNGPHRLTPYRINQREEMRWLDRWVKGVRNGVETEYPVTVFWEVRETEEPGGGVPNWETHYPSWPVPQVQWLTLHLTSDGSLTQAKRPTGTGRETRAYVYPLGTELVGSSEQFRQQPYALGSLTYRTSPMAADIVVLGSPKLHLYCSTDRHDTDFMFTLSDVDTLGNVVFLQRTVLRASLRGLESSLSNSDEWFQSFATNEYLAPGEVYELRLSLSSLGHVIRAGHRLELSVSAPNSIPSPIWAFSHASESSVNTIHHGESCPSMLQLPIVPGECARGPAPRPGTLRNQPHRAAPSPAT